MGVDLPTQSKQHKDSPETSTENTLNWLHTFNNVDSMNLGKQGKRRTQHHELCFETCFNLTDLSMPLLFPPLIRMLPSGRLAYPPQTDDVVMFTPVEASVLRSTRNAMYVCDRSSAGAGQYLQIQQIWFFSVKIRSDQIYHH